MDSAGALVDDVSVGAYTIPTDGPESDGTYSWTATTLVIAEVTAAGRTGIGYTYSHAVVASLIRDQLRPLVIGTNALDIAGAWEAMLRGVRNLGRAGLCATAISAVDAALWDLKGRLLELPVVTLLGQRRQEVLLYGSGGFTSYTEQRLREQLAAWVGQGIDRVKMKVGTHPEADPGRVAAARQAIGDAQLFVDANGAYSRKQALALAERFDASDVGWLEEPVSSDDLDGLRLLRDRAPAGMDIAAGEYGYDLFYFRRMLAAGAVDVLQADASRCLGITGFLAAATLAAAHNVDLSSHCAPALHLHAACAAPRFRHAEWFHDHVRIEKMMFDGAPRPRGGVIAPDLSRPGLGFDFKRRDALKFAA